jgi:hypothetical protein
MTLEEAQISDTHSLNPGFAVKFMLRLNIFFIFSKRSRLLREVPKYAVLTTRG